MEFLAENSNYVVLGIALIIWIGLGVYLLGIDKKLTKLENNESYDSENN